MELMLLVDTSASENSPAEVRHALRILKKKGYEDTEAHAAMAGMLVRAGNIQTAADLGRARKPYAILLQKLIKGKLNKPMINAMIPEGIDAARFIYSVVHLDDVEENDAKVSALYHQYSGAFWKMVDDRISTYATNDAIAFERLISRDGLHFLKMTARLSQACWFHDDWEGVREINWNLLSRFSFEEPCTDQLSMLTNLSRSLVRLNRREEAEKNLADFEISHPDTGFADFARLWMAKDDSDAEQAVRMAERLLKRNWNDPALEDMILQEVRDVCRTADRTDLAKQAEDRRQQIGK